MTDRTMTVGSLKKFLEGIPDNIPVLFTTKDDDGKYQNEGSIIGAEAFGVSSPRMGYVELFGEAL